MNRRHAGATLFTFCVLTAGGDALAAADGRKRTLQMIDLFKGLKSPEQGKPLSAGQLTKNTSLFKQLDGLLDEDSIVGGTIEPHKSKFKPEELKEFKELFWKTLRLVAYPSSGVFFHEAKYDVGANQAKGGGAQVLVQAELVEEDIETEVLFHWKQLGGALRLVDVSFDGASLMHDYRNQFGRIIGKRGVGGFLDALRKKHSEVAATKVING